MTESKRKWEGVAPVPAPLVKCVRKMEEPSRGPPHGVMKREEIARCGRACTMRSEGGCSGVCWLPAGHCKDQPCDHSCRNCWVEAPTHITQQRDEEGRSTIRPVIEQHPLNAGGQGIPKPGPSKNPPEKPTKQIGQFAGWFVAETEGRWSRRIHAVEAGTDNKRKTCACQVSFKGRRIKVFSDLEEAPLNSRICANCFRQLSVEMWNAVIAHHAELVPLAWTNLTGN